MIKSRSNTGNIFNIICIILFVIILVAFFVFTNNSYNDMIYKYKLILNNNYKSCLSMLSYEKDIEFYYEFINLINKYEEEKNMFSKSQISIKIINFGNEADKINENITELVKYAKNKNVFVWISALYQNTINDEYDIYKSLSKNYDNIGLTLSCSHSSVSNKVDEILNDNGHIRLVKGIYKGDITDDNKIRDVFVKNANKLCNSNDYQCICTHDFDIINNLNLYNNKNIELSFYYTNLKYVKQNLKKYNIVVKNISFYFAYGSKIQGLIYSLSEFKLSYYDKKRFFFAPLNYLLN